jgi:hypothetical protein
VVSGKWSSGHEAVKTEIDPGSGGFGRSLEIPTKRMTEKTFWVRNVVIIELAGSW